MVMSWLLLARIVRSSAAVIVKRPAANDVVNVRAGTTRPSNTSMPGTKRPDNPRRPLVA